MDRGTDAIRVALCDDSFVVRHLLSKWISDADGLEVAGESADGLEAVELVRRRTPDVLVLDLDMPEYDGVYAIEKIREFDAALPIIIHSGSSGSRLHEEAHRAGSTAFVPKTGSPEELISAIRAAVGSRV
jgi:DNA-binding NarL/FixJ family response regulator